MKENILIESHVDQKLKDTIMLLCGGSLLLGVILMICSSACKDAGFIITLILSCILLVVGIIFLVIFLAIKSCKISITEHNVKGKTLFGKEVVLPLYMVSAYTTSKLFSTIAVATSSGITKFSLVKNYDAIGNVLAYLINERQANTINNATFNNASFSSHTTASAAPETKMTNNTMDDLIKLKDLLDKGIITQEDFDAKKKEFLGL